MKEAKILIAEGDATIAMEMKNALRNLGYKVTSIVDSGEKAIEKAETEKPDLMLMDIGIKGDMDGIDTAEVIRNRFGVPVVFSMADVDEDKIKSSKITMPFRYILKPIQNRDLKVTIEIALHSAEIDVEHQQAEDSLKKLQHRQSTYLNMIPMGVIEFDNDFNILSWNPAAERIFGYTKKEALGRSTFDILVPDYEHKQVKKVHLREAPHVSENINDNKTKDGRIITCQWYNTPILDIQGDVVGMTSICQDITEKLETESVLKDSEEKYRNVAQNAIEGICVIQDNRYKYFNPEFVKLFGYSADELEQMLPAETIYPEDREMVTSRRLQREGGKDVTNIYSHRIVTKDGRILWVENKAVFITWNNHPATLIFLTDITERKQAELALKDSEEKYKIAFKTNPNPVLIAGLDRLCVEINDVFTQLSGYSAEEIIGKSIADLNLWVIPEDRDRILSALMQNGHVKNLETIFRRKDGSHLTALVSASIIELNNVPHILSITHDITDRKQLEEDLKQSEEKYRSITENANEGILIAQDQVHKYANPKICDILGYTEKELLGSDIIDIVHPDDREMLFERYQRRLLGEKFEDSYDLRVVTKTGDTKWLRLKPVLITWDETPAILSFLSDVTEQKKTEIALITYKDNLEDLVKERTVELQNEIIKHMKTEEKLQTAKEVAESANKAKSEFLANMSHELRTPLNAVTGFSELLSSLVSDTKQKSYLQSIKTAGRSLLTLINDILDLSKIEAGRVDIQYSPINLKLILDEIEKIFGMKVIEKNLEFSIHVSKDLPTALFLDETRIRQVLLNLVGNAVKFTESGTIRISVDVANQLEEAVDLTISVEDSGIGIPEESLDKIFNSFEQQSNQVDVKYGGTGLGLTITQRLVGLMKGQITVCSAPGTGSVFKVALNNVKIASAEIQVFENDHFDFSSIVFNTGKILVVDDVESNRIFLSELLQRANLEVLTANDGREGILLAKESLPSLIIMDIRMPVMDGIEATKQLKSNPKTKKIPVIALTASTTTREKTHILSQGFDGFLSKPVKLESLFAELSSHLEYTKRSQDNPADWSPSDDPDTADIIEPAQLIDTLKNEILPNAQIQKRAMVMGDITVFAERLRNIGEEHQLLSLACYADELIALVDMIDIENIEKRFQTFSDMIEALISKIEKSNGT